MWGMVWRHRESNPDPWRFRLSAGASPDQPRDILVGSWWDRERTAAPVVWYSRLPSYSYIRGAFSSWSFLMGVTSSKAVRTGWLSTFFWKTHFSHLEFVLL